MNPAIKKENAALTKRISKIEGMKNKIIFIGLTLLLFGGCRKKLDEKYTIIIGKYKLAAPMVAKIDDSFDDNWAAGK